MKSFSTISYLLRQGQSFSGLERNCCFLNTGGPRFATFSSLSGFDFLHDARGLALVDWDFDGDIDLWLSNRTAPRAQFLRNDLAARNHFLALRPRGTTCNRDAIGARLELWRPSAPRPEMVRTLYAGEGFLAQSSHWMIFGLGTDPAVEKVIVRWPGGAAEEFPIKDADCHYELVQGSGAARRFRPRVIPKELDCTPPTPPPVTDVARIVPISRLPVPNVAYKGMDGSRHRLRDEWRGSPLLINFWATWCKPCLGELAAFGKEQQRLEQAGLRILAINVDELNDDPGSDLRRSQEILERVGYAGAAGAMTPDEAAVLDIFHRGYLSLRRPVPVPTSFLVDANGDLLAIYKGAVDVDRVVDDLQLASLKGEDLRAAAIPFPGRWREGVFSSTPRAQAVELMREGYHADATDYLNEYLQARFPASVADMSPAQRHEVAGLAHLMADLQRLQRNPSGVVAALRLAVTCQPHARELNYDLGKALVETGSAREGVPYLEKAIAQSPNDANMLSALGIAWGSLGDLERAAANFGRAVELAPHSTAIRQNFAMALERRAEFARAAREYRTILEQEPQNTAAAARLGWLLAAADGGTRNGQQAVSLAEKLLAASRQPDFLEILAAGFAEMGRFSEASTTQRQAVAAWESGGDARRAGAARSRLILYQSGRPYRLTPR